MITNKFESIYSNDVLKNAISDLLKAFVYDIFLDREIDIKFEILRYSGWLASILAESPNENHQKRSQLYAILIHFYKKKNPSFDKLSYIILSRLGNLVASKFLLNLYENKQFLTKNFIYESIKNTHHNLTGISDSGASNSVSKINLNKFFINLSI